MPKISIIIPVYNVAQYLPKCLDSVLAQTLPYIEIICINDGSTDNSSDILQNYAAKDKRIKIINQNNQGICKPLRIEPGNNQPNVQARQNYIALRDEGCKVLARQH